MLTNNFSLKKSMKKILETRFLLGNPKKIINLLGHSFLLSVNKEWLYVCSEKRNVFVTKSVGYFQNKTAVHSYAAGKGWIYCNFKNAENAMWGEGGG